MAGLPEFLPDRLVTHAAFGAVVLPADGRRSIVAGARVGELVRSFRDASVACVIYSEAQPPVTHAALRAGPDEAGSRSAVSGPRPGATTVAGAELAVIDADRLRGDDDSPVVEELLRAYHAELVAGHTAGVVLYKQRRFEPGSTGTNVITDALNKRQRAALNLLIRRAKYWGSFIVGSAAHPITATAEATEALEIVAFAPGGARFVLVWNTAPDRFARGSVLLPDTLLGRAVGRVVEVPPIPGRGAGHVLDSDRSNRFRISINLRPGDAALFEIFPPA